MPSSLLLDLQTVLVTIGLITPRALVCLSILPGFCLRNLTGVMRNAVAIALVLPAALPTFLFVQNSPPDYFTVCLLLIKEAAIGLLFGTVMSIPVWVAESIGSILDTQRSPIQNQMNNASVDRDASALGAMLLQAVIIVMIQAGLFVMLCRILIESYAAWPAFSLLPPFETAQFDVVVKQFADLLWHIVVYGGPILIPLMLIDVGFSIVGSFAPNLQISALSSPVKCVVGMFILLVYWPIFSHYVVGDFAHILDFSTSLLQASSQNTAK